MTRASEKTASTQKDSWLDKLRIPTIFLLLVSVFLVVVGLFCFVLLIFLLHGRHTRESMSPYFRAMLSQA